MSAEVRGVICPAHMKRTVISHVPLDNIAFHKVNIGGARMEAQVNTLTIISDNVLGTRIVLITTIDQVLQPADSVHVKRIIE